MRSGLRWLLVVGIAALAGCGPLGISDLFPGPSNAPDSEIDTTPTTVAQFSVSLPQPGDAGLDLEMVDPVTGIGVQSELMPMTRQADGRYQAQVSVRPGSLIRYRYRQTGGASEATAAGRPIRYRVGYVPGPTLFEDAIAAWDSNGSAQPTGRILGQLTDSGGTPLPEMIVTAAGMQTFTDSDGRFRLERLPIGLQNLVAYDPTGGHRPAQQGAVIAADGTTPASLTLQTTPLLSVTFELTVPAVITQPPRIVGNLAQFGDVFSELAGGAEVSRVRAPEMVQVDQTHYLLITSLGAGTNFHYKYTLGDGLWNAERDLAGRFRTRQLVVTTTDAVMRDEVVQWGDRSSPLRISLQPPDTTPAGDSVTLSFNPFTWFDPLTADFDNGAWSFDLYGPAPSDNSLSLRACRNLVCEPESAADQVLGPLSDSSPSLSLSEWGSWSGTTGEATVVAPAIQPRPELEVGLELLPRFHPAWVVSDDLVMERVAGLGANTVTLTPAWRAFGDGPAPRLEFDPASSRTFVDLARQAQFASDRGLQVVVRPELLAMPGGFDEWWRIARRNTVWWEVFYEELESFLVTQAVAAERIGAERLVVPGDQLVPALPDGLLADGSRSAAPFDAESRWLRIVDRLRSAYSGPLAFEIGMSADPPVVPTFIDQFDFVHVHWHPPLSDDPEATVDLMSLQASRLLDEVLLPALPQDMPVVLSIEYASVSGVVAGCPPLPDGSCRAIGDFDLGQIPDPDLQVDLQAQSRAINATLLAATEHPWIAGITIRRTFPQLALQDRSASIYGKPAADVIGYWYPRLRGEIVP